MRPASRWLRRAEIALWFIGVSLLGVALGATVHRTTFQAEQSRVLESRMAELEHASSIGAPSLQLRQLPDEAIERRDEPESESPTPDPPESPALPPESPVVSPPAERPRLPRETVSDVDLLGRIEIPRLGLSAVVLDGDDDATLQRAVGRVSGTAAPGDGGNTALAGHRDTFFRSLQDIRIDDQVRLVAPPHTYEYRVDSVRIVDANEVSVLDSTGVEELTLVTCYPFRLVGPAPDRFIVKATRVQ